MQLILEMLKLDLALACSLHLLQNSTNLCGKRGMSSFRKQIKKSIKKTSIIEILFLCPTRSTVKPLCRSCFELQFSYEQRIHWWFHGNAQPEVVSWNSLPKEIIQEVMFKRAIMTMNAVRSPEPWIAAMHFWNPPNPFEI